MTQYVPLVVRLSSFKSCDHVEMIPNSIFMQKVQTTPEHHMHELKSFFKTDEDTVRNSWDRDNTDVDEDW